MESNKNDNSNNNEQQGLQYDNEEEVQVNNNNNENDKVISVDDIEEKEKAYKAEIEQLNAEIELERLNNAKLQSELNIEEQLQVLRKELTSKTTKLQQLQNTNTKQKDAIEQLSLQIKKHSDKSLQHKKTKLNNNNNNETNNSIDIILKSKDKELNNLLSLVNVLAKDNKEMKRAIDMNGEYKMKVELNDKNKLKETKLHKLNEDIKHMKLLLEEHKQCVNDKHNYITQLQAIQNDITSTRTKHAELRNELLLTEEQNKAIIKPYLLNAKSKTKSNVVEEEQEQIKDKQDISRDKQIKYKIITDNVRMFLINKSNYYEDTENQQQHDQQERLVLNKIEEFEKMQSVLEKKNKIEIRTYELKVNELQDQIINVNKELKEKESKNKIMKCEINEIKNDIKKYQGLLQNEHYKCEELGQELNNKIKETNQWKEQLNSLRRLVQQTMDDPLESEEYKEYINKVREDVKKAEEELNEEKDNKEEQNENEKGNEEEDNEEQNEGEDDDDNDNEEQNENEEKVMEDKNI